MYLNKTNLLVTGVKYLNKLNLLGSDSEPVVNYVARLEPVANQYWSFSEDISYVSGDTVELKCSQPRASFDTLFATSNNSTLVRRSNNGSIIFGGCTIIVDGSPAVSGSTQWPDEESTFLITLTANGVCEGLGVRTDVLTGFFGGYIYGFKDSKGNEIPLTNKEQGATQLAVSGSVNAFMPNYTSDVWEVRP